MITPTDFAGVKTITMGVHAGHILQITTGVAIACFPGAETNPGDWIRDEVSFLIGPTLGDVPPNFVSCNAIVFVATFDQAGASNSFGWGIDEAWADYNQQEKQVRVHARIVSKTPQSEIIRLGFVVHTFT